MSLPPLSAVVLAAGEGSRMRSERPKPLHRLCGRPMILHVLDALAEVEVGTVVVVVGHRGEWVTKTLVDHAPGSLAIEFVEQSEQRGTGDALAVALTALPDPEVDGAGDVVVLAGDTPLVRPATLASLVRHHRASDAAATVLSAVVGDPTGYDRVVRRKDGAVVQVVYDAEGDVQRAAEGGAQEHGEVATAIHCFRHGVLAPALRRLPPVGPRHEQSLTALYAVLRGAGYRVESMVVDDPTEVAGVNDRIQLAQAEAELRRRINERWMRCGVTMWDPGQTCIDATVRLGPDVVLGPGVVLQGDTVVDAGAEIGPGSHLVDSEVGEGAVVLQSTARGARIGIGARVGPFAVLHDGAQVPPGAVVAPFTEVEGAIGPLR